MMALTFQPIKINRGNTPGIRQIHHLKLDAGESAQKSSKISESVFRL